VHSAFICEIGLSANQQHDLFLPEISLQYIIHMNLCICGSLTPHPPNYSHLSPLKCWLILFLH